MLATKSRMFVLMLELRQLVMRQYNPQRASPSTTLDQWLSFTPMEHDRMSEYHVRIKELPASEQPRERLRDYGPSSLSDAELVVIPLSMHRRSDWAYQ